MPFLTKFIANLIAPLFKGEIATNAAAMKHFQNGVNIAVAISTLIGLLFPSVASYVNPQVVLSIAGIITATNVYITTASTDKIGL